MLRPASLGTGVMQDLFTVLELAGIKNISAKHSLVRAIF
jgi:ribosomal protein S5